MATTTEEEVCGYDLKFLSEPPESLKCLICHCVARLPRQHEKCGRVFCRRCLYRYHKTPKKACAVCKRNNPQYFEDNRSSREILSLKVACSYQVNGCLWEGETKVAEDHMKLCGYQKLGCPKRCQNQLLQKDLQIHVEQECVNRDFECPLCGEWGVYEERTSSHLIECPGRLMQCRNRGCTKQVAYNRVDDHARKDCDYTIRKCKYKSIGCTATVMRKDLQKHENDDSCHLHCVIMAVEKLRKRSASAEIIVSSIHRQEEKLKYETKENKTETGNLTSEIERLASGFKDLRNETNILRNSVGAMHEKLNNTKRILQEMKMEIEELNKRIPQNPGENFDSTVVMLNFKAKFEERINKMTRIYQTLEERVEQDFTKLKAQYNQVKLTQQNTHRKEYIRDRKQQQEERIHERIKKLEMDTARLKKKVEGHSSINTKHPKHSPEETFENSPDEALENSPDEALQNFSPDEIVCAGIVCLLYILFLGILYFVYFVNL